MKLLSETTNGPKNQEHKDNNVVTTSLTNARIKAKDSRQAKINNTNMREESSSSPNTNYSYEIHNGKGNTKSQRTPPKQYKSNYNKNNKKTSSHMYYNIPTTTAINTSSRKKYHHLHNNNYYQRNIQQQYSSLNNNNDNSYKNQSATQKNDNVDSEKINQKLSKKRSNSCSSILSNVEDFVNNNIRALDANNTLSKHDFNMMKPDIVIDNSVALSSHRSKSELNQYAPTQALAANSTESTLPTLPLSNQHNCIGENSTIEVDCNSCWSSLVNPQNVDLQKSWPWTNLERCKSPSVSSISSNASIASSSSLSRQKTLQKGDNTGSKSSSIVNDPHNHNCVKDIKYALIAEIQTSVHGVENSKNTQTAMTTALASTAATTSTTNSATVSLSSDAQFLNPLSASYASSSLPNASVEECSTKITSHTTTNNSEILNDSSPTIVTLASISSGTPTPVSVSLPSVSPSTNSYSLDFLHSVGEQMTGVTNLSAISKKSPSSMRTTTTTTTFNADSNNMISPAPNSYTYENIGQRRPTHTMPNRYVSHSGCVKMGNNSNNTNFIHMRDERGYRFQRQYHHQHHQPHPLTLGAFMQKELINENNISSAGGSGVGGRRGSASNSNICDNGRRNSGIVDVNNNSNNCDYTVLKTSQRNQPRYHNYYQSHHPQSQQQLLTALQHECSAAQTYHRNEMVNSIDTHSQQYKHQYRTTNHNHQNNADATSSSSPTYQSHHNASGELKESSFVEVRNEIFVNQNVGATNKNRNNVNIVNNNLPSAQDKSTTKKNNNLSSSTSSGSMSSVASNSSQAISSKTAQRRQKNKSASQLNLVIETLPRKKYTSNHRNHRLQQPHQQQQQQNLQKHSQYATSGTVGAVHVSTAQQLHQNIHNLTYVNTDEASIPTANVNTGMSTQTISCSPSALPPPLSSGIPSPHSHDLSSSSSLSTSTLMTNRYMPQHFHTHPHQQQQNATLGSKSLMAPLSLNASDTLSTSTASISTSPIALGNIICYTTKFNDLTASYDSTQQRDIVSHHSTASKEYDDSDCSSSTSSLAFSQQLRTNHRQKEAHSVSRSSSASSICSTATAPNSSLNVSQQCFMTKMVAVPPPQQNMQNDNENADHAEFPYKSVTPQQYFTPQLQSLSSPSPQQQQITAHFHNNNGMLSMLNVSLSNCSATDDEFNSVKHQSTAPMKHHYGMSNQQRHFYLTSGDHLNGATLSAHAGGNAGYWSPLQHSNFLYPQIANLTHCATAVTPAMLSPRENDYDEQHNFLNLNSAYHQQQQQQQINVVNNSSEEMPSVSNLKRSSTPHMGSAGLSQLQLLQHQRLRGASSAVFQVGANNMATMRQRNGGRTQTHLTSLPPSSTPSLSHVYAQHNLLFGAGPQTHICPTMNSSHDYFAHTPPDRFLARSHLIETKETPNTLLNNSKWDQLSQCIWNKFINSQQTEETFKQKMLLWRYLYIIIKNAYPRFGLYLVGSTISGFGADTSDVDMCLVSRSPSTVEPRMEALINLTILRDYLSKSVEFENFHLIEAKVPILRFRDRVHQLEVDLNFNNCVGIKNTHLLYCYSQLDWRLRPLVLVIKLWAQYHNINNAKTMTISSYSLVLMVIHFLQYAVRPAVLPCLHDIFPDKFPLLRSNDFGFVDMNETMCPYESKNTQTIGELFLSFLEYYSSFDYTQFAISIRTGGLLPINVCRLAKSLKNDMHQWKELCIEEPFDLTNTARSVYDVETFERVKAVFVASWRILQQTLDLNTIFAPIIIPSPTYNIAPTLQYDNTSSSKSSSENSRMLVPHDRNALDTKPTLDAEQRETSEKMYNAKTENKTSGGLSSNGLVS